MSKIFISYARKDKDEVYPIVDEIERNGFDCWIDKNGIESGDQFKNVILDAIDGCEIFIYMLSANTLASDWCQKEFNYANGFKKIIPVLLKGAKENRRLMFDFSTLDCIDIYDSVQKEKFIRDLKRLVGNTGKNVIVSNQETPQKQNSESFPSCQDNVTSDDVDVKARTSSDLFLMNVTSVSGYVVDGIIRQGCVAVGDKVMVRDNNGDIYYTEVKYIYSDKNQLKDSASSGKYGLWLSDVRGNLESAIVCNKDFDLEKLSNPEPVLKIKSIVTKSRIKTKFIAEVYSPIFIGDKIKFIGLNSGSEYGPYSITAYNLTSDKNLYSVEIDGNCAILVPGMLSYL
ncbi:MAG: toll/interleukin-1 receptor domain-containing protein [Paludibacteraceae bacterium]|nr:toll/interleukin-1 receptor domain-containing protein [Paludibacteraceae bacterium]